MQNSLISTTRVTVLALSVGLIGGCASTSDLERVEGIANQAASDAAAAKAAATGAQSAARDSAAAAAEAQRTGDAAQRCCSENSEKLDRMFHKAMHK